MQLYVVEYIGESVKLVGKGQKTGAFIERVFSLDQLSLLDATPESPPYDGDASRFWLAVEAARLRDLGLSDVLDTKK